MGTVYTIRAFEVKRQQLVARPISCTVLRHRIISRDGGTATLSGEGICFVLVHRLVWLYRDGKGCQKLQHFHRNVEMLLSILNYICPFLL